VRIVFPNEWTLINNLDLAALDVNKNYIYLFVDDIKNNVL